MELLLEAAGALADTPHNQRGETAMKYAESLGVSVATLYRRLKKEGLYITGRKRSDKGAIRLDGVEEDHIKTVMSYANTSRRNTGSIEMPIEKAIMDCEANELIPKGVLLPSTVNRHLRRMEMNARALLAPTPHQPMASKHPNHVHEVDPSVCLQWYFDGKKGMDERDMVAVCYKNKPDELAKAVGKRTKKILRYVLEDHFTGELFVHYYHTPGETSTNMVDFLIRAWTQKDDDNPFHGAPALLLWDQGSANKGHTAKNFCEALDVEILTHLPHNARAKGAVEKGNHIVQTWFESGLRITPATDIDSLNEMAAKWCIWFNATRKHTRHGMTRAGLWQTIRPEQLRVLQASHQQLRQLADGKTESRRVRGDYRITMGTRDGQPLTFSLADIVGVSPGKKVEVRRNAFEPDEVKVRLTIDTEWISIRKDEYHPEMQGGFMVGAPIIGEEIKSQPHTQAMKSDSELEQIAYGVDSDAEAKRSRNRKETPFKGMDAHKVINDFQSPAFMKRRGVDVPLAATAEPAPLKGIQLMKHLKSRLGRALTPEENQRIKADHPNGMNETDIETWLAGGLSEKQPAVLRAV